MAEQMKPSGVDWIGEIPSEWNITKVRFVTELRSEQGSYNPGDKYIGLENISSYTGTYISTESEYDSGTYDIYKAGDLLFSKLRPYLAKALITDDCGFCTGELAIIKEYKGDIRYLFYYMLSDGFLKMTDASTYGSKMPRASWDYIKNLQIPAMEKREQQAIADYLDKECAQIDSIAADLEKQIELLQQYKKSLITETVTKGLDKSVPMKDSGIEWIGEIPYDWEISRVKYHYEICLGKMLQPIQENVSDTLESYMCSANVTWAGIDLSIVKQMWFSPSEKRQYRLLEGDLLVSEGGDVAVSCIWKNELEECYLQNAVHRVRQIATGDNRFIYYWLFFLKNYGIIDLICNKATIAHFTKEKFGEISICIMPLNEQQAIADYLDEKCATINSILDDKQAQLKVIQQHKKSLIYEYVTGKKRVKEAQ